jgi:hypothetical protein
VSERRGVFRPILALVIATGCWADVAQGAENGPAPAAAESRAREDGIDAAKREFELMKASRDPAQQQKGALPKMTLPELQRSTDEPRPWLAPKSKQSQDAAAKKSKNWLVEAMAHDSRREQERLDPRASRESRRGRGGRADEGPGNEEGAAFDPEKTPGELEPETPDELERSKEREVAEARREREAVNPLTSFLGDWMTARDYAILKPALDDGAKSGADGFGTPPSISTGGVGQSTSSLSATLGLLERPTVVSAPPRDNPYLQSMQSVAPEVTQAPVFVPPPVASIVPAPGPGIAAPTPAPVMAPRPQIPDFAKPAQDEKYFKQLKRF